MSGVNIFTIGLIQQIPNIGIDCTASAQFKYTPTFKLILDIGLSEGIEKAGIEFTGSKVISLGTMCIAEHG